MVGVRDCWSDPSLFLDGDDRLIDDCEKVMSCDDEDDVSAEILTCESDGCDDGDVNCGVGALSNCSWGLLRHPYCYY